jgi:hypothetical protein
MTAVFLSHRRPDGSAYVRRLSQELAEPGGGIEIVPGLESLVPGTDIVEAIEGIVDRADVVLAVIGPDWLTDSDQHGRRRLDLAADTVRIELATALRRPDPVIPVLVGGAIMPQPDELPVDLAALARRTPIELRDSAWAADVARLRETVRPLGPAPEDGGDDSRSRLMRAVIAVLVVLVAGLAVAAFLVNGEDDDDGSTAASSTATTAATSQAEETTTAAAPTTAEATTTEQATTEPPPTTTTSTAPDLSAVLFQDALTPPSAAFVSGPGDEGCTFTPGQDGYQIAVAAEAVCTASGFLDDDQLPVVALAVTAALPPGSPAPVEGDDAGIALACAATDSSDYLATIAPDGAFELLRRTDTAGAPRGTRLASGTAEGISLTDGAVRLRITCTTSDAGVRIQVAADDETFISLIDPDPLPPGLPTFGASLAGEGSFGVLFTDLVVNGPSPE